MTDRISLFGPCPRTPGRSDLPQTAPGEIAKGIYFARSQSLAGWRQITCRNCGAVWRVPESQITEVVQQATDERQMTEAIRGVRGERDTRVTLDRGPEAGASASTPWSLRLCSPRSKRSSRTSISLRRCAN